MGTYPIEPSKSYPMNTNITGLGWFSKILNHALDKSILSIRIKTLSTEKLLKANLQQSSNLFMCGKMVSISQFK